MGKHPTLTQIFKYNPGAIDLVGFPHSEVFDRLSITLGQEVSLRDYQTTVRKVKLVTPSFFPEYIEERQQFFKRLPKSRVGGFSYTHVFPKGEDIEHSAENFLYFCRVSRLFIV